MRYARFLPILSLLLILAGCSGPSLSTRVNDFLSELQPRLDSVGGALGGGVMRGVRDTLTSMESKARLASLLDSLITAAGSSARLQADSLRMTLLSNETRAWVTGLEREILADLERSTGAIRTDLLGPKTEARLELLLRDVLAVQSRAMAQGLRDDLLGPETNARLVALVAALRDEAIGDTTMYRAGLLRDELLGPRTRGPIDSLVSAVLLRAGTFSEEQQGFITKNASTLVWTAVAAIALLIGLAWFFFVKNRQKEKIIQVVAHQIHNIPDQSTYDSLTARIQDKAKEVGVEPHLRTMLKKQGLIGDEPTRRFVTPDPAL